jgi:hypothetical protein
MTDITTLKNALLSKRYLKKRPLFKTDPLRKLVEKYYQFYEEFNLDKTKSLKDIFKDEPNEAARNIAEALEDFVELIDAKKSIADLKDEYKKIIDKFNIIKQAAPNSQDIKLTEEQINVEYGLAVGTKNIKSQDQDVQEMIAEGAPSIEPLPVSNEEPTISTPAREEQKPPPPPTSTPLPKPKLRGAGAGAGGGRTPDIKVKSVTPRRTPKVTQQVEPITLPVEEQPPPPPPMPTTIPQDDKPLSVPTATEDEEPIPMSQPQTPPIEVEQPPQEPTQTMATQTEPIPPATQEVATQTEEPMTITRKATTVADEQQPSKIDLIPKERLSAENKNEQELLDDINYFYKTFPNELKNIDFDRTNTNLEYLKRKHKEIVAKLTAGKKREEKIGIIISGSEYIKEKLKEIILENSINGLSARDLIINVEKTEAKQSSDINSYEFKMGVDGKPMAKKEPIYKYLPEVVKEPVRTKPARIPNTQTKFRSLVTTARREVAQNPFSKPQPKIRLKYSY